jgi:restriction system protein
MSVPSYDRFIEPILRYLASHPDGGAARDIDDAAASALQLTEADKRGLSASSIQPVYKNRAGWARDRLKRAGLSINPRRGYWQLTLKGMEFANSHQPPLSEEEVQRLATDFTDVRLRPSTAAAEVLPKASALASPDDRLDEALGELKRKVVIEISEALSKVSPTFFETIVLNVVYRMGYGASAADLQRVGGAGDAGIDGVISLDKLGLEKVYIQAKHWKQSVGRPEIQAFHGALAGQHAKKGVFITTANFTAQAEEFARSVEGIVLIDGSRLADLMIEAELGVNARTIKVPKIDSDFLTRSPPDLRGS